MAKRAKGRRWTAAEARSVLDAWKASGQSGAAFARSIGVVAQRLFWWRRRIGGSGSGAATTTAKQSTLVPVIVGGPVALTAPVVVTTPTGVRIEVVDLDETTATWVVAVLCGVEGRA
jgi:hypothetical protein